MKNLLPNIINPRIDRRGFTLIELLIVIAIIGILSVIGIAVYSGVQKGARDARRMSDVESIGKAWEAHYSNTTPHYATLDGSWFSGGTPPRDPQTGDTYTYTSGGATESVGADTYIICATLENNTGNYNDSHGVTPNTNNTGAYFCIKNQQ